MLGISSEKSRVERKTKRYKQQSPQLVIVRRSPRLMNKPRVDYRPMLGIRIPKSDVQRKPKYVECLVKDTGTQCVSNNMTLMPSIAPADLPRAEGMEKTCSQNATLAKLPLIVRPKRVATGKKNSRDKATTKRATTLASKPEENPSQRTVAFPREAHFSKNSNKRNERRVVPKSVGGRIPPQESVSKPLTTLSANEGHFSKKTSRRKRIKEKVVEPALPSEGNISQRQTMTSSVETYTTNSDTHQEVLVANAADVDSAELTPVNTAVIGRNSATNLKQTEKLDLDDVVPRRPDPVPKVKQYVRRSKQKEKKARNHKRIAKTCSATSVVNEKSLTRPEIEGIQSSNNVENVLADITSSTMNGSIVEHNAPSGIQSVEVPGALVTNDVTTGIYGCSEPSVEHMNYEPLDMLSYEGYLSEYCERGAVDQDLNLVDQWNEREILVRDLNFSSEDFDSEHTHYHQLRNVMMVPQVQGYADGDHEFNNAMFHQVHLPAMNNVSNRLPAGEFVKGLRAAMKRLKHYSRPFSTQTVEAVVSQVFMGVDPYEYDRALREVKRVVMTRYGDGAIAPSEMINGYTSNLCTAGPRQYHTYHY